MSYAPVFSLVRRSLLFITTIVISVYHHVIESPLPSHL